MDADEVADNVNVIAVENTAVDEVSAVTQQHGLSNEERQSFTDKTLVAQLTKEVAQSFDVVALVKEEIVAVEELIEQNLTQIDEFQVLLETIKADQVKSASEVMPRLIAKTAELQALYHQIDQLEAITAFVRKNVDEAQDRIEETERLYKINPISKVFSSIKVPFIKRQARPGTVIPRMPEFRPIDVFSTDELFLAK